MKKVMTVVGLSALCLTATAQSSLQIYGIVDASVEHLNTTADGSGLTRVPNQSGRAGSRLGFRGEEKLGSGLSALYTLEMGIGPDAGTFNQGGRAFGRQSWVGLKSEYGTLSLGRQYTMLLWAFGKSDVLGGAMHSIGNLDSYLAAARIDNAVAYRVNLGKFDVGATYSFGRDALNLSTTNCFGENAKSSTECTAWSAMVKYDEQSWGLGLAVDQSRGGPNAAGGAKTADMKDRRILLSGYKTFGDTRIGAGLIARKNDAIAPTPNTKLWYLGVAQQLTPSLVLDLQASTINNTKNENDAQLYIVRLTHSFSKRTAIYTSIAHARNSGAAQYSASASQAGGLPSPGKNQSAYAVGLHHSF